MDEHVALDMLSAPCQRLAEVVDALLVQAEAVLLIPMFSPVSGECANAGIFPIK
jgi:hypothetical protein